MLSHLSIQNMAIIESLQLDLNEQMTVLTGETGAGKSIIIDAISLLIGDRASTDLIRHHEDKAVIEGIFEISKNKPLKKLLNQYHIDVDDQLVIKRMIKRTGKGQIRANGELITVNQLRELGQFLVDIHVQHDTHRLFQPENNYHLIDNLSNNDLIIQKNLVYQVALKRYKSAKKAYLDYQKNSEDIQKRLDLMIFQKNELEKANLKVGELEELEKRRHIMVNADKLHQTYTQILTSINCDGGALERLYEVLNLTQNAIIINPNLNDASTQINDIYYGLEEYIQLVSAQLENLSYDPEELEEIESRLNELQQLKRKYRMDISELIAYYEQVDRELSQLEDTNQYEEGLLSELKEAHRSLVSEGEALNDERKAITELIKDALVKELHDLQLYNAQFDVAFRPYETGDFLKPQYSEHGIYEIQFLLSTNKGEPLKPLHKVASGGELSRVMLALKTILNRGQFVSTIIFDEIDTGVSGQVASSIGSKMKEIAKKKQVLCITHLPQVASLANYHIHVSKYEKDARTVTTVKKLTYNERSIEIARMLSSDNITESALQNAMQLLQKY